MFFETLTINEDRIVWVDVRNNRKMENRKKSQGVGGYKGFI